MYVFRDGRRRVAGRELVSALLASLRRLCDCAAGDEVIPALIRAGELESALADSPDCSPQLLSAATVALDAVSESLVTRLPIADRERIIAELCAVEPPASLTTSPLEGFAYYALHPMTYAALAESLPGDGPTGVIGIRSIGCVLSAVVLAALRKRGFVAHRTTVRPVGHPFDRRVVLDERQEQWLAPLRQSAARFLVCDEGPGLSGSSMLATGEALVGAGVEPGQITFLCSRPADPEKLCAHDAARRWQRFRALVVGPSPAPQDAAHWIGAGAWRNHPLMNGNRNAAPPLAWATMERSKFVSRDQRALYKFEGFGHYGERVRHNAKLAAGCGFAPRVMESPASARLGYAEYEFASARHATAADMSHPLLLHLAEYCAVRERDFRASPVSDLANPDMTLAGMCTANAKFLFGIDADFTSRLPLDRPVLSDSRMAPHEWLITQEGKFLKTDGASHGDDHFFPGPCDIAWDLAGTIVEWNLSRQATDLFCEHYRRLSGDDPAARLLGHILAYALFRAGYCQMAAESLAGDPEQAGLERAHAHYARLAERQLNVLRTRKAA